MPRICLPSGTLPFGRPFHVLAATSVLLLSLGGCGNTELSDTATAGTAGLAASGAGGGAGNAGAAPGAAGAKATAGAGNASSLPEAGAGGQGDEAGAGAAGNDSSDAGAAGTGSELAACEAGGPLFVVGNYQNAAGDQLLLRSTATASTIALVPHGAARPDALPQLFLVERSCAPGGALLVRDESAHYRLDFVQSGGRFALCTSAPVATLDAALQLAPGCASKPFSMYDAEAL